LLVSTTVEASHVDETRVRVASAPQARIIAAALELFAQNGVGGTSHKMIADAIGLTKAAVYHQFKTKDEIVLAAAEDELARLEAVLEAARMQKSRARSRQVLLTGIVDLAVDRRRTVNVILSDPVVLRFFDGHLRYVSVVERLNDLLMGPGGGVDDQVQTAMFMAAISGAVMHPMVADLDDLTLRAQLLRLARRFR
jgi:AcrR family transcriptional regulator